MKSTTTTADAVAQCVDGGALDGKSTWPGLNRTGRTGGAGGTATGTIMGEQIDVDVGIGTAEFEELETNPRTEGVVAA